MFKRIVLFCALFAVPAHAGTIVYQNDFESGMLGAQISGPGFIESSGGYSAVGFGNSFLHNSSGPLALEGVTIATTITLNNLPQHDSVDFGFLLALINSWDGDNVATNPDFFQVFLDGALLFEETFTTFDAFPQTASNVNRILNPTQLGFNGVSNWLESAYDFTSFSAFTNIAHNSNSLTLSFTAAGAGWSGDTNESFGLDNISISLNGVTAVPEPAMFGIFGLGLLGLLRRRALF